MQGSAKKNLLMFKKLCGKNALKNVILATTMWDRVPEAEAVRRESQLVETPEFWGWMTSQGSKVLRHNNTADSAMRIVEEFVSKSKTTLDIQNQMVNEKKTLDETGAGRELENEIAKERELFAKELREAQSQMEEALKARDEESIRAIRDVQKDYADRMKRLESDREELKISMEKLHEERYARLEKQLKEQQEAHARDIQALKDLQKKSETKPKQTYTPNDISSGLKAMDLSGAKHQQRSLPGANRVGGRVALSMNGTYYFLDGPANQSWSD